MAEFSDLARIYREVKYRAKNFEQFTLSVPPVNSRSPELPLPVGARNAVAVELQFDTLFTATAAENHIANSKASDAIQLIEFLDPGGGVYHDYPNYGVAATDATKPLNRLAQFMADDSSAIVTEEAGSDFGGAGTDTLTYDVVVPITIPANTNYRLRITPAAVTAIYAADVTMTTMTITATLYLSDEAVPQWYCRSKAITLGAVGVNPLAQNFKDGETIIGWYWVLVTTTEATSEVKLKKNAAAYFDAPATVFGTQTNMRYTFGARLTGETLVFTDSLTWDSRTTFDWRILSGGAAGTLRLMTFHPAGSAAESPDARNAASGYQPPTPTTASGTNVQSIPHAPTSAAAKAQASQTPAAGGAFSPGPGSFDRLRSAIARR